MIFRCIAALMDDFYRIEGKGATKLFVSRAIGQILQETIAREVLIDDGLNINVKPASELKDGCILMGLEVFVTDKAEIRVE